MYATRACVSLGLGTLVAAAPLSLSAEPGKSPPAPKSFLEVGKPAPRFRLRALDRAMVRLDEIAYAGREKRYAPKQPVLLDFFRTDCEPCVKALPQLVALHHKHREAGLRIVLVALLEDEEGEAKLRRFLDAHKLPFTVVKDATDHVAKKYMGDVVVLPATFLIDRTGVLRTTKFSAEGDLETQLGDELQKVLAEHTKARSEGRRVEKK